MVKYIHGDEGVGYSDASRARELTRTLLLQSYTASPLVRDGLPRELGRFSPV